MIYAQIRDDIIENIIVVDDPTLAAVFAEGFDSCERIDDLSPSPCIGWVKVSEHQYRPPVDPEE